MFRYSLFFYHRKQTLSMVLEHNSSFLQRSNLNQSSLKCQYYAIICNQADSDVTASRPDQTGTASRYKKLPLLVQNSSPDSSDRSKLLLTEAWSNANMILTSPRHQIEHLLPLERLYWPELINASNHRIFSNLPACSHFSKIALARSDLKLK